MGKLSLLSDQAITLSAYLSGHGVRQIRLAGPDRFGLLTETMNGQVFPGEKEEWHYVPLPPANNLAAAPQSNLPLMEDAVERFSRDKSGCVTFVVLDAIWSVGLCRDLRATVQAVAETDRTVQTLVEYALRHQMRVLICGDMGMAEAYVSADGERIEAKETDHPLPCLLIHPAVEGLRAGVEDYAAERVLPLQPLGALSDIPATIAALMGLPMPSAPVGKVLFAPSIQATLS